MTEIPIFPLRSVLCPGVALPLHIFEERYRLMVGRCIDRGEPFGVVLLREGHEVGPLQGQVATVGTTAAIRRAGAYPDGRMDILTVGQQRFRIDHIDRDAEPYLVGQVSLLDEPTGPAEELGTLARRVGERFLEYLGLLQPANDADGPEIELEFEIEVEEGAEADAAILESEERDSTAETLDAAAGIGRGSEHAPAEVEGAPSDIEDGVLDVGPGTDDLSPAQRRELLMAAARRLTATDDPTALSYVLTSLVQVDLSARQDLLEVPDTVGRLARLERLLTRESWFLRQGLRPIIIDPRRARSLRV